MHAQEVDVLQSQISKLILNLQTLTPSNAWKKRLVTTTKQLHLKELDQSIGVMSTMNTNMPNKFMMNCSPYIKQRSNSQRIL